MAFDMGRAFHAAWRLAPRLPEGLVRGVVDVAFRAAARSGGGGVRQLRANYSRIRPDATPTELDRLARQGMREYGRYYAEAFLLPKFSTPEQLADRVRAIHTDASERDLREGSVVLALGHTGNWDIAGAWVSAFHATVLTVAERLEPESLFREFLAFRESLGMEVLALEKGQNVFRQLVRGAVGKRRAVSLLADRDLTLRGVEVDLLGDRALFAAGPAAVALAARVPLYFVGIRSDRITGSDGRKRWGIELEFVGPLEVSEDLGGSARIASLTQAWVDELSAHIRRHPTSWHMLQKVFVADLDPDRLSRRDAMAAGAVDGPRVGGEDDRADGEDGQVGDDDGRVVDAGGQASGGGRVGEGSGGRASDDLEATG
nr:phosphatidylinositol mannoside acyltransferase [Actinomycetales bacterium]